MERVACPYWKTLGHNFFFGKGQILSFGDGQIHIPVDV
jgi:hypothetical protein